MLPLRMEHGSFVTCRILRAWAFLTICVIWSFVGELISLFAAFRRQFPDTLRYDLDLECRRVIPWPMGGWNILFYLHYVNGEMSPVQRVCDDR